MFYLLTYEGQNASHGDVVSVHKTETAALDKASKMQPKFRSGSLTQSYRPLWIMEATGLKIDDRVRVAGCRRLY